MSSDPLAMYAGRRGSAQWFVNRLRCMTPAEVFYRTTAAAGRRIERWRAAPPAAQPAQARRLPIKWIAAARGDLPIDATPYEAAADRILAGEVRLLDDAAWQVGNPPRWFADLLAPADIPEGPLVADCVRACDERLRIELHRHQALVTLAQAWRTTRAQRYRDACDAWLAHWLRYGSHPDGPAWNSALEAGLRLLNWSVAWQLLDSDEEAAAPARERWLNAIFAHARLVRRNLSRHSSANNHLIGELTGLYLAALTWPHWPELIAWGDEARAALIEQALAQNAPDGVNREQSTRYQVFVFELVALATGAAEVAGTPFPAAVYERLGAMARFIAAMRDAGGHVAAFGDADGARVLRLDPRGGDPFDVAIGWGVALGVAPELAPLVRKRDESVAWLLGRAATMPAPPAQVQSARARLARCFPQGGYFVLGSSLGQRNEVLMQVDGGPLGYLGIAAHGHADALSICLSLGGEPVLVDRGTYVYNAEPRWRRFLRGTLAHNTVCVDGLDQSVAGGPFLWITKAHTELLRFSSDEDGGELAARQHGYRRLRDPVLHTRQIDWTAALRRFHVVDTLACQATHEVAIAWHFAPACTVRIVDGTAFVDGTAGRLALSVEGRATTDDQTIEGTWTLHRGDRDELLGWHSDRFGERVPAPTLAWRARIRGASVFVTTLALTLGTSDER